MTRSKTKIAGQICAGKKHVMPKPKIILACRHYDGTHALIRGRVELTDFELNVVETENVAGMFTGMFQGKYDVSEMSLAELIYYVSRGKNEFTGIPVFPSRFFRHGFLLYNTAFGIRSAYELSGRRIGFLRWVQTAAIWIRGTLIDEYGVSPRDTQWYVASFHHWKEGKYQEPIFPRNGAVIHEIEGQEEPHKDIYQALLEGKIDILGTTENESFSKRASPTIRQVFENSKEVEIGYFQKTKIFPIMHVIVVGNSVAEKYPDLPEKLFTLFSDAKKMGREWLLGRPSMALAWKNQYVEEEKVIFGCDPWAYGLKPNEHVLNRFLKYCYDEGVAAKQITPGDLFFPSTLNLTETKT